MNAFGATDKGLVRSVNQDAFLIDHYFGLFLVADGMGGARAGELASAMALESVVAHFRSSNGSGSLRDAYLAAHAAVRAEAESNAECCGMGTTLVGLHVTPAAVEVASAGDSRAYLLRSEKLTPLTRDQSWIEEIGRKIGLCEDALKKHPFRHVITMAIGINCDLEVRSSVIQPQPGDRILLCTDGLHGPVDEKSIAEALIQERNLSDCAHSLIEASKQAGAPDNVTVLLLDF